MTITVKGTLKLDGAVITDTKVVGNVTYKVDTDYIGKYSDLDADAWYAKGADGETLKYVLAQGLMEGSDGKFSPNAALTREQLAVVLYRASGSPAVTGELKAPDASKVSAWASDAMKWAVEQKIITGNDKGELNPKGTVDRQTMAVMLFRWADGKVADGADLKDFSDAASVATWASDAMKWAVNEGLVQGAGGKLNPAGSVTRITAAMMLGRYQANKG